MTPALTGLLCLACGSAPKPAELVSFEQMQQGDYAFTVQERHPELHTETTKHYKRALTAHEDSEEEETLVHTRLATMTWRSAVALSQKKDAEDATRAAETRLRTATEQLESAQQRRTVAEDAIARQRRLLEVQAQLAAANTRALAEKSATDAKAAVDAAALKLKEAETLEAAIHAPGEFAKAQAALKMAFEAFGRGDYKGARAAADHGVADAQSAIVAATPKFAVAQKRRELDAQLKAMLVKTGEIPGAEGRIEQRGLVVTLRGLFAAGKDTILPEKTYAVQLTARLAKENTAFRIVIEGHTDNRGRPSNNMELSDRRARAVANQMAGEGVSNARVTALGKGDHEPVADNSNKAGREQNRRVDLIFLRPIVQ